MQEPGKTSEERRKANIVDEAAGGLSRVVRLRRLDERAKTTISSAALLFPCELQLTGFNVLIRQLCPKEHWGGF